MSLTSTVSQDGKVLTICLGERFDFASHEQFRDAYQSLDIATMEIVVNFNQTEYLDSAALGMLLVLRERAGGDRANIVLESCHASVHQIIDITRFDRLFKIKD